MTKKILTLALVAGLAVPAFAQEYKTVVVDDTIDNVTFAVESAIIDKGLVIDSVSHVGEMLARTGVDMGSDVVLFEEANVYNFCSASVSREVMEADLMNIAFCPYGIFVFSTPDTPDQTTVGHRIMPGESMTPVNTLLDAIIADAVSN